MESGPNRPFPDPSHPRSNPFFNFVFLSVVRPPLVTFCAHDGQAASMDCSISIRPSTHAVPVKKLLVLIHWRFQEEITGRYLFRTTDLATAHKRLSVKGCLFPGFRTPVGVEAEGPLSPVSGVMSWIIRERRRTPRVCTTSHMYSTQLGGTQTDGRTDRQNA